MTSNNIANHVFPARNLPGSAETWGREIEDAIKRLDGGITIMSSGMGNLERGVSGQFATSAQHEAQIAYAESLADRARVSADGKSTVWRSPEMPEGADHAVGDTWFDESESNKIYTWDGEKWADVFLGFDAFGDEVTGKISDAYEDAQQALSDALQAQTSADGKNSVHYGSVAPPGTSHKIWDTWFDSSNGNRINEWNGSTWVPAEIGTNAIGNNAITNAKIGNLDAGKITSGEIDADRIGARTITVNKLLVGDFENLFPDRFLELEVDTWSPGYISTASDYPGSGNIVLWVGGTAAGNAPSFPKIQAEVGDEFVLEYSQKIYSGTTGSLSIWDAQTLSVNEVESLGVGWARFRRVVRVNFLRDGGERLIYTKSPGGSVGWADILVKRRVTGGLIVDGAITADSAIIADGAIGNAKIADAAITNAKIHDATIQHAKIGTVDAGTISVGTLDANRIAANSITAAKISGGDFAGKTFSGGIFTGSTFRTAASGARTEMAGTGVTVYNSSNQAQVQMGQGIDTGLAVRMGSDMIPLASHVFGMLNVVYTSSFAPPKGTSNNSWGAEDLSSEYGVIRTHTGRLAVFVSYMYASDSPINAGGQILINTVIRRPGVNTNLASIIHQAQGLFGGAPSLPSSWQWEDMGGAPVMAIITGLPKNVDLTFRNAVRQYTYTTSSPSARIGRRQVMAWPV